MQHQDGSEIFINKTKEYKALIKRLVSKHFNKNGIQYVIDIVTLCGRGMIELENKSKSFQAKINGKHSMLFH